jgi:hypothetical protein
MDALSNSLQITHAHARTHTPCCALQQSRGRTHGRAATLWNNKTFSRPCLKDFGFGVRGSGFVVKGSGFRVVVARLVERLGGFILSSLLIECPDAST